MLTIARSVTVLLGVIGFGINEAYAQPAPVIRSLEIVAVRSANNSISDNNVPVSAIATTGDHGGAWIEVDVRQMGYSSSERAVMDTYSMSLLRSVPVTNSLRQIVGWTRTYRISRGFSSGTVKVYATSINNGRTWSDSIRIR